MANKFLSRKIIIPAVIFFGGLAVASSVFILANFTDAKLFTASQVSKWTQNTGEGISIPACSATGISTTCSNGAPVITVTGDCGHLTTQEAVVWPSGEVMNTSQGYVFVIVGGGCGSVGEWSASVPRVIVGSGSPDPVPPLPGKTYAWDVAAPSGHNAPFSSGAFTTPNCSTGTLQLRATLNGVPWSGIITYNVSSPLGVTTTTRILPYDNSSAPTGDYTYTYISGGPPGATFTGITPSSSQTLSLGETITFTFNFVTLPGDFTLSVGGGLACNSVPLSWTASSGADGYRILKGAARVDITPYNPYTALNFTDTDVVQNTTYKYQIEAYNESGTNRSNSLNITTPYCPPTLNFSGDPTTIYEGGSSTLTWLSTYTTSCIASGAWSGSKSLNGDQVVIPLPPPSVTYTMTCTGLGGSTGPQSVIINVTPLGLPQWKEIIPR
ncbi:MAG: hypothetical protein HYV51_01050 [Parcubacteria group bacterium]|nr:hypothetical protein [Parcubacteria group bacterium]